MNAQDVDYDPDLAQVLEDIANDSRAKLLRVPNSGDIVRMMRPEPVGVAAPGLTAAERHLLEVHREEVVFLLRQKCLGLFFASDAAENRFNRCLTPTTKHDILSKEDWAVRSKIAFDRCPMSDAPIRGLRECLAVPNPSPIQVARILTRITSSSYGPLYEASYLADKNQNQDSITLCKGLIGNTSSFHESFAWQIVGRIHFGSDYARSRDSFERASLASPEQCAPPLYWLIQAVLSGDTRSAERAADSITVDPSHRAVSESAHIARWNISRACTSVPPEALNLARLVSETSETSARTLNVFFKN